MADAHLTECCSVSGTFYAVVICTAGEAVPHCLDICRYCSCRPVRIAVVGDNTSKMLELIVFIFYGSFQPVVAVQVHDDAALVEAVMAYELTIRLEDAAKIDVEPAEIPKVFSAGCASCGDCCHKKDCKGGK